MKYIGKAPDMFGGLKFWLLVNLPFKVKIYAASRESNIELLILISDFMVNSTLINTQRYFYGMH